MASNLLYLMRSWGIGGSHTIVRTLLRHLPADDFNIVTAIYDAPGGADERFAAQLREQGSMVLPERIPWRSRANWRPAQQAIAALADKYKIDLIHCHDTQSNVLVGMNRRRFRVPCIASPYGWWESRWNYRAKLYHWFEKHRALPNFDYVYTVSEDMKKKILAGPTNPERICVIHTGIDLAALDRGASKSEARAAFGFQPGDVVVGTLSRLEVEKGHAVLLKAAASLARRLPQLRLLIVGHGGREAALKAEAIQLGIADRVVFAGFHPDMPGALRAMDIFCQPSIDHEGFPTAVLEAQACGLPVVASDIGGTGETLGEGTGILTAPGDADALASVLASLIENAATREAMALAARPWIESQFTLPDMIAQMTRLYRDALAIGTEAR